MALEADLAYAEKKLLILIDLRPCQHHNGYMDGRSQIKVRTDERTQVHSARYNIYVPSYINYTSLANPIPLYGTTNLTT